MIFVSSCSKVEETIQNNSLATPLNKSARLSDTLTNEAMENAILAFISKIEAPVGQTDMNVENAFEYIEAALNYKYVNYDYSKCANSETFYGTYSINPDGNNMMTMSDISKAFNDIRTDWSSKYHGVEDEIKTPIVFDITSIEDNTVNYTMVVGKGSIDLKAYTNDLVFYGNGTYYHVNGARYIQNQILNFISNTGITLGSRSYFVNVGIQWLGLKGSINSNDPIPGDGYIDYQYFYTNITENGYHLFWQQFEYSYYKNAYFNGLSNFISSLPGYNEASYYHIGIDYSGPAYNPNANPPTTPNVVWHEAQVFYGTRYITPNGMSTL
jgi:hypothetical protein